MTVVDRLNVSGDDNNRAVWAAQAGERQADIVWTFDAGNQVYAESGVGDLTWSGCSRDR